MAPTITQCPHCKTAFRVTQHQLNLASGNVRCGCCLSIFKAQHHWLTDPTSSSTEQDRNYAARLDATASQHTLQCNDDPIDKIALNNSDADDDVRRTKDLLKDIETDATIAPHNPHHSSIAKTRSDTGDRVNSTVSFCAGKPIAERQSLVDAIATNEIDIDQHQQPSTSPMIAWGVGSLIALIALVLQYGWFNLDQLSRNSDLRPYYGFACQLFSCTLPQRENVAMISSRNLIVRPDNDNAGILNLDMIIINNADYPQPYPNIRISFSDINNTVISSRTLNQNHYLRGELSGSKEMPSQRQIHISLQIVNPSNDISNYRVSFEARTI